MKLTKTRLKEIIREELLNEAKDIFKTKIKGLEKNNIALAVEPHSDRTMYALRINGIAVGVFSIFPDGKITMTQFEKKVKVK